MTSTHPGAQALLRACRDLMRCILTLSRREEDRESLEVRVRAARGLVEEAVRSLDSSADDPSVASLDSLGRIAAILTTQLVHDHLTEDERRIASEADRKLTPTHKCEGLRGYAWTISVPDLMGILQVQQKSGVLRVNIGTEVVRLIFDGGDLIHASSDNSPPGFRLGEILVSQEAIGLKDLELFLLSTAPSVERLGNAMEEQGLISRDQLRRALDHQIQGIFHRLFAAKEAYYTFREGHAEETIDERRNVFQLLLETCRVNDEARHG